MDSENGVGKLGLTGQEETFGRQSVHFLWIVLAAVVVLAMLYRVGMGMWDKRQIYHRDRVTRLENERRQAWERRQRDLDPNVGEEGKREVGERVLEKKFDVPKEGKKRFGIMFGMGNVAARACNTGS